MPVPGQPRNPLGQSSDRFHRLPILLLSRRQDFVGRTTTAVPDVTLRRLWRNLVGFVTASASSELSWTRNSFGELGRATTPVTTPLRYFVGTVDVLTAGNQLSNPIMRPPIIRQRQAPAPPLVYAGNVQNRPTVRNRIISFGSRVPALNSASRDAAGSSS